MDLTKVGKVAFVTHAQPSAAVNTVESQDMNSVKGNQKRTIQIKSTNYQYYPWGSNNLLPNEMIDLYRTNGDVMNLVQTRADFLYGEGGGWFQKKQDGDKTLLIPYFDEKIKRFEGENDTEELTNGMLTHLCEMGNVFVNHSREQGQLLLSLKDPLTVRGVLATLGYVDTWLLCPDWSRAKGTNTVAIPARTADNAAKAPETLVQLKRQQSGQFYYGFAVWWAAQKWIKLANRVPDFHNNGLDTEYNANKICRVAEDYFRKFGGDDKESQDKTREQFYQQMDAVLFSGEGKRKIIFDECSIGTDGKMQPWIEFENIVTSLSGKEYSELYQMAITAFANASGILSGLAGVSDGKMLGGSGSELRVSAQYQQFYRTPRERQVILSYYNRTIKQELGLPDDVVFGFKNVVLETLDDNKSGASKKNTSGNTGASKKNKANQENQ